MNARWVVIIAWLIGGHALPAPGGQTPGPDGRAAQVHAATLAARQRLADDLAAEALDHAGGVTVGSFFKTMRAVNRLNQLVAAAEPVGGVRWVDDQTCQVRVELQAGLVAETILSLALADPNRTPIPYARLESRLRDWHRRSFSATGGSVTVDRAVGLADATAAWRGVSPAARREALLSARVDAGRRAVESLANVDPQLTDDDARRDALLAWATEQPLTGVRFGDDQTVEVTMTVPPPPDAARPPNAETDPVTQAIRVTGRARAVGDAPERGSATRRPPLRTPDWVSELIEAGATADPVEGRPALKTARAAERAASDALRGRIERLSWEGGTLADAAGADNAVARALDRAVAAARVVRVDYRADGSVAVRLMVDGRVVWREVSPLLRP